MSREEFSRRITEYCRVTGNSRQLLASKMGLHPSVLSHKINGTGGRVLSHLEIRQLVKILADWEAISSRNEVQDLLELVNCPDFSPEEWHNPPLNHLHHHRPKVEQVHRRELKPVREEPVPPPHNLPYQLTSFVGRDEERTSVKRLIMERCRILTIMGAGGVGKTRLSLEVANELLPHFKDGVWLMEFAHIADPTPVAQLVAKVLNIKETANQQLEDQIVKHLREREVLLIFDNCEHLVEPLAALAITLLRACPRLKILANSREALLIPGELTWGLATLGLPEREVGQRDLAEILRSEAVRLFVDRAAAANPAFKVTPTNAATLAQICRRLDGIPLAVELVAARVRGFSLDQIATRLAGDFKEWNRLLAGSNRAQLAHHQTLLASLEWSYRLLSEEERTLLRRIAIFRAGFTLTAAEEVCSDPPSDFLYQFGLLKKEAVMDLLLQLVNKSMVVIDNAHDDVADIRYRMLEPVAEYALENLREKGEYRQVIRRAAEYFMQLAEEAEPNLLESEQKIWLERIENEQDNFRSVLTYLLDQNDLGWGTIGEHDFEIQVCPQEVALRISGALWRYWQVRSIYREGISWLKAALEIRCLHQTPLSLDARAKVYRGAGAMARNLGDYDYATESYRESYELYQQLSNKKGMAHMLLNLGIMAWLRGDFSGASDYYQQSLDLQKELSDRWGVANVTTSLGDTARVLGDYEKSLSLYQDTYKLYSELGDKRGTANSLLNMGDVCRVLNRLDESEKHLQEALEICRGLNEQSGIANILISLGDTARARGSYDQAEELASEGLEICQEINNSWGIAYGLNCLGEIALNRATFEDALGFYRENLELQRTLGDKHSIATSLEGMSIAFASQDNWSKAFALFQAAERIRREIGAPPEPSIKIMLQAIFERQPSPAETQTSGIELDEALELALT